MKITVDMQRWLDKPERNNFKENNCKQNKISLELDDRIDTARNQISYADMNLKTSLRKTRQTDF